MEMAKYLKPFEFESEESEKQAALTEINECIMEIDRSIGVMEEWERSNNFRTFKIRGQQNMIRGMRCLP